MIARYKGIDETVGIVHFKPGSVHSIQAKRKIITKNGLVWILVDGMEEIPYTLEGLFTIWEPVKEWK